MPHQDETDKPLIAIWIPEAMEWSKLGSNTEEEREEDGKEEEEEDGMWTHRRTQTHVCAKHWHNPTSQPTQTVDL